MSEYNISPDYRNKLAAIIDVELDQQDDLVMAAYTAYKTRETEFDAFTNQYYNPFIDHIDKIVYDIDFISNRIAKSIVYLHDENYDDCTQFLEELEKYKKFSLETKDRVSNVYKIQARDLFINFNARIVCSQMDTIKIHFCEKRLEVINLICMIENRMNGILNLT